MKYFYNGIELPALPEWDKTAYPYVVLTPYLSFTDKFVFYAFDKPLSVVDNALKLVEGTANCVSANIGLTTTDEWSALNTSEWSTTNSASLPLWANYDVLNEDGSVYLAASDPVPVPINADLYFKKGDKVYKVGADGGLPTATTEDNGKFVQVVDGLYALVALQDVSEEGL